MLMRALSHPLRMRHSTRHPSGRKGGSRHCQSVNRSVGWLCNLVSSVCAAGGPIDLKPATWIMAFLEIV